MWGVRFRLVTCLEGCGEVNEVESDRSNSSHRIDHEVHLIHSFELSGDCPRSQGHSCNALRPSRPYARARWVDDNPFRTPTCKENPILAEILKKFGFSDVKTASTLIETHKPLLKDADGEDVDEHMYRSMIGSLMYLTSSRPYIMFAVCACARFQVNPKNSHLHAVKRIFRYLKGQTKLGLWYPKDSPFDLVAYTDSDYAGASLDKKSTTGSSEYIAASNCYGQVLWIQNQLLDYGYNFMQTKIHIDNESTICIVKNHVFHSKTKHIEIRHHFIKDSNEKKLIQMIKIHTDQNVADLLTKAFDVIRFEYLIVSIGMVNL
ncbi:hypothetical protein Tco_0057902 [Tanacetum coccineum]